jgi:hypothetical protein
MAKHSNRVNVHGDSVRLGYLDNAVEWLQRPDLVIGSKTQYSSNFTRGGVFEEASQVVNIHSGLGINPHPGDSGVPSVVQPGRGIQGGVVLGEGNQKKGHTRLM